MKFLTTFYCQKMRKVKFPAFQLSALIDPYYSPSRFETKINSAVIATVPFLTFTLDRCFVLQLYHHLRPELMHSIKGGRVLFYGGPWQCLLFKSTLKSLIFDPHIRFFQKSLRKTFFTTEFSDSNLHQYGTFFA